MIMPVTNMQDLGRLANTALRQAMADERSKRWQKVGDRNLRSYIVFAFQLYYRHFNKLHYGLLKKS